ncbi:uncharacterized protein [Palaemon carinicauda]|uniref:uncharacterized protein n=1 Tax=Palaemon carinicauda TaxID=392227 RepID=UPI0035B64EB6
MPKLKQPKGRGRKMDVMEETADRESPHSSFSSLDMVIPETQQDTSQSQVSCDDDLKKKRVRVSKKDIPDYQWTEETETTLADLVKENPMLFDKKHKEWINKVLKDSRWAYIGSQLEPPATAAQCKKRYENLRTRVGKIMKKEKKSGAGQAQRSGRDDFIMDTWSFLIQHIVRGETVASEEFRGSEGGATTASEVDDDVRSTGTRSQASTTTRKDKGKGSCRTLDTSHSDTYVSEKDFSNILRNLVSKADSSTPTYMGQHKIVHDFSCLLEGYMRAIPVHRWHEFQIECLNLTQRYRDETQVLQQAQQQSSETWAGPQQQQPLQPPVHPPVHQQPPQQQSPWQPPHQQSTWQPPHQQSPWQPPHQQSPWQPPHQQQPWQSPQPGPSHAQPEQQQQHRPASHNWVPQSSPSSLPRTTEWHPGMPTPLSSTPVQVTSPSVPVSSPTLVQAPSPAPSLTSLSAAFKSPLTFPVLTPGTIDSSLDEAMTPSPLYSSKELDTPPVKDKEI